MQRPSPTDVRHLSQQHEKYVYLAKASPYSGVADARALLAERVESLVSQEHAKVGLVPAGEHEAEISQRLTRRRS